MNRRGFLKGILAAGSAPFVVTTAGVLMPVRERVIAPIDLILLEGHTHLPPGNHEPRFPVLPDRALKAWSLQLALEVGRRNYFADRFARA